MLSEKKNWLYLLSEIKPPIDKLYNVVTVILENKDYPESKIQIEALMTDEIFGSGIPPYLNLCEVTKNKCICKI